ncbi:fibronectin type III domain-containing protein [Catenuloplanes atrovinosus]|uniref:Fibronectin type-III domain-containing protein n=1 Tax=Catenuloplanes atrovinosus TaxID=137266 RepID=A0AAE3YXR4_9ACTN|nr:fibronectin type III domain-containing protein [Catenuloplanes atrovinosus]MDR7280727.1 hypothetical protein [Catenuloplanes atrovinosus]
MARHVGVAGIAGAVVGSVLAAPALAVPVAPTALTVSPRAEAVWASWTAPPGTVDHYMAWAYDPGSQVDGSCMVTGTSCLIGGLDTGVAYTVRVAAYETDQASSKGAEAVSATTATPGPPSTPTAPTAAVTAPGKVSVTWGAGGGGIAAESFRVTSTPASAGCVPATPVGTNCTVTGLDPATSYTFRVTARGPGQTGTAVSDASPAVTPAVPNPPTDIVVNATTAVSGTGEARISWLPPATGGTVSSYTALVTGPGGFSDTCVETTDTYCDIAGLTDQATYNIRVFSNGAGESSQQQATATYIGGSPSAPDLLAATGVSPTGVTLNWDPTAAIGTAATNPYTVTVSPAATVPTTCVNAPAVTASCAISGLTPGVAYKFRVGAAGGTFGQSTYTSAFSVAARPARVENVKTSVEEGGTGRITWTLPQSDVVPSGINVYEATDLATNGAGATPIACVGGAAPPLVLSGKAVECILPVVSPGTTNFVVRTFGWSEGLPSTDFYSDSASTALAVGAPGRPYIQEAVAAGAGKATITLRRPAALGAGIESYLVTSAPDAKTCTAKYIASDDPTSCTIEGLTGGTSYTFTVKALGVGGNDDSPTVTSEAVLVGPPGVATSVTAKATENSSITVAWKPPADNTIPITSYTVRSTTGGLQCTVLATATPLQCVFDNLAAGSTYKFTVSANSQSAGSSDVTTESVTVGASAGGVPTGVQASANSGGLRVAWSAVAGVAKYQAMATANGKSTWCAAVGATNLSCTIKPLEASTEYTVAVRSVSAAGIPSAWSTEITAVTRKALPTIVWPATSPGGGGLKSSGGYVLYRNSRTTISGYGYLPGESVWVYLYTGATKVRVGGATVKADGTFATAITIPVNATRGGKRLLAGGWDADGDVRWQNAFITVR